MRPGPQPSGSLARLVLCVVMSDHKINMRILKFYFFTICVRICATPGFSPPPRWFTIFRIAFVGFYFLRREPLFCVFLLLFCSPFNSCHQGPRPSAGRGHMLCPFSRGNGNRCFDIFFSFMCPLIRRVLLLAVFLFISFFCWPGLHAHTAYTR